MKPFKLTFRDVLALALVIAAAIFGIYGMMTGELMVNPEKITDFALIKTGFQQFFWSFALILLFVGAAFVLIGFNDRVHTNPAHPEPDDE